MVPADSDLAVRVVPVDLVDPMPAESAALEDLAVPGDRTAAAVASAATVEALAGAAWAVPADPVGLAAVPADLADADAATSADEVTAAIAAGGPPAISRHSAIASIADAASGAAC